MAYVVTCKLSYFLVKLLSLKLIHTSWRKTWLFNWRISTNFQGEDHIRLMVKVVIQEKDEDKDYVNDCSCIQVAKSALLEFTHF